MGVDADGSSPIKKGQWDVWLSILIGMALWNYHPGMVRPLFLDPCPLEARTSMFASLKNERKETAKMQEFLVLQTSFIYTRRKSLNRLLCHHMRRGRGES